MAEVSLLDYVVVHREPSVYFKEYAIPNLLIHISCSILNVDSSVLRNVRSKILPVTSCYFINTCFTLVSARMTVDMLRYLFLLETAGVFVVFEYLSLFFFRSSSTSVLL